MEETNFLDYVDLWPKSQIPTLKLTQKKRLFSCACLGSRRMTAAKRFSWHGRQTHSNEAFSRIHNGSLNFLNLCCPKMTTLFVSKMIIYIIYTYALPVGFLHSKPKKAWQRFLRPSRNPFPKQKADSKTRPLLGTWRDRPWSSCCPTGRDCFRELQHLDCSDTRASSLNQWSHVEKEINRQWTWMNQLEKFLQYPCRKRANSFQICGLKLLDTLQETAVHRHLTVLDWLGHGKALTDARGIGKDDARSFTKVHWSNPQHINAQWCTIYLANIFSFEVFRRFVASSTHPWNCPQLSCIGVCFDESAYRLLWVHVHTDAGHIDLAKDFISSIWTKLPISIVSTWSLCPFMDL